MAPARRDHAVTLIELLVTLAVVGTLAGLAYPAFRMQLLRAHRSEAIETLLRGAAAQERYMLATGRYATTLADSSTADGLPMSADSSGGRYRLTLVAQPATSFLLRVTPRPGSGQEDDRHCMAFTLRADGLHGATDDEGRDSTPDCWG